MRMKILILGALLSLAACASPLRTEVARFHQMPPPAGQTFYIQPADPKQDGSLEFNQYAALVRQRLTEQGYQPAANAGAATMIVDLSYGVNDGREKIDTRPGFGGYGFGYSRFGWGWGRPWYGRGYYPGFYDPFFDPFGYPEVYSYTVFNSHLDMKITRAADGTRLFEGRAVAQSGDNNLTRLVPDLVQAMFTNFPGRSGETARVTVSPPKQGR